MSGLIALDVAGLVLAIIGFHVTFRQKFMRGLVQRMRSEPVSAIKQGYATLEGDADREELASVWRMVGVMLMAFSISGVAFANIIVRYTS